MTVYSLTEHVTSRSLSFSPENSEATLIFDMTVKDPAVTLSEQDIYDTINANVGGGLNLETFQGLFVQNFDASTEDNISWRIELQYGRDEKNIENPDQTPTRYSLRPTGNSVTIDVARAVISKTPAGAPDRFGVIAEDDEGNVQGIDIFEPGEELVAERVMPFASYNQAYRQTLRDLTYKVNNAAFLDYAIGEVLYLGPDVSWQGSPDFVTINHVFSIRENETRTFGPVGAVSKEGWQVYDVHYSTVKSGNRKIKQPQEVHVLEVYPKANFTLLGTL